MIENLKKLAGKYYGEGINHEGQPFKSLMEISSRPEISGLAFTMVATGLDGSIFHSEYSLIGKSFSGGYSLWITSNNHPAVFERPLRREEKTTDGHKYVFGFGDPSDKKSFREEVHIEVLENAVRNTYFWGMPGGEFAERSGSLLKKG